ncbi:MAG TPA: HYR domain-containing protein [Pirellulaceae bacterium]|nr:HYR domain-containing protein [Pirellulaceae bacterium]
MARTLLPFAVVLLLLTASSASAQTASIVPIELPPFASHAIGNRINDEGVVAGDAFFSGLPSAFRWSGAGTLQLLGGDRSSALGIAADGNILCGIRHDGSSERAVRWTNGVPADLGTLAGGAGLARAHYMTSDGSCIVGVASAPGGDRAFRLLGGTMRDLGALNGMSGSAAEGASADGAIVVGGSPSNSGVLRAFRWKASTNLLEDLGALGGGSGESLAWGITDDGSVIVGGSMSSSGYRPFIHTDVDGMQPLSTLSGIGTGAAYGVSADGGVIAGASSSDAFPQGEACFWIGGQPLSLGQTLLDRGADLTGWTELKVCRCSPNGKRFTGQGVYQNRQVGFLATIEASLTPPRIDTWVAEGTPYVIRVGQTFRAPFVGSDPDDGSLTIGAAGLPSGATLSPQHGTTGPSPMAAELMFAPTSAQFGRSYPVRISFNGSGGVATRSFTIVVPANQTPTVGTMAARSIECLQGHHEVELASVVSDREGSALNVTWKVDGVVRKTQSNVPSGSQVAFAFDYDHGVHTVTLEASDGLLTGSAGTAVTVQDTLAPVVIVAPDVTLETDAGKAFATYELTPPTVFDASGHPTTLASDAPSTYPTGETNVMWTATDEVGNQATAMEKVTVVDREKPSIVPLPAVQAFCDPGQLFATVALTKPTAADNSRGTVNVTTASGPVFPIGTSDVVWTVTDPAGNASSWTQQVTVTNRAPIANAGRNITVTTKSEKGARILLNGSASSDPDLHSLRFKWTAPGVKLKGAETKKPAGVFRVGTKTVTLTVTDAAGLLHKDTVKVTVKLKNGKPRSRGADANRAFAASARHAAGAVLGSKRPEAASALAHANAAAGLGDVAGELVQWEEGQSPRDALLSYAEVRALQRQYGRAAAVELLRAYAETGDERLLAASLDAALGTACADADLMEP